MKRDRASELRAIADGRLMLNVRNGVTVSRSMLAMIADEFEAMSTALAAKDAELAEVHQRYVDANEARIEALEAENERLREALTEIERRPEKMIWGGSTEVLGAMRDMEDIARRAREGGNADG